MLSKIEYIDDLILKTTVLEFYDQIYGSILRVALESFIIKSIDDSLTSRLKSNIVLEFSNPMAS